MSSRHRNLRRQRVSLSVDGGHGSINFRIDQKLPDPTGQVTLEAAYGFDSGLALGLLFGEEVAGGCVESPLGDCDAVQGAVELAVAAAVEAVADSVSR
jgi:hypothetical protein